MVLRAVVDVVVVLHTASDNSNDTSRREESLTRNIQDVLS